MPAARHDSSSPDPIETWLVDARAGSRKAIGQVFESCRPYLLWLANHELAHDVRAKTGASDIVQQTFLRAQNGFDDFRGRSSADLHAWLRQILLRTVANVHRQYRDTDKRRVGLESPLSPSGTAPGGQPIVDPAGRSASSIVGRDEEVDVLMQAIGRLAEDYRRVIVLRHWERFSFAEIGHAMGRSSEAARKLWARAFRRLQQELESSCDER